MAKTSYHVTDATGKKIGVLFLDISPTGDNSAIGGLFENVAKSPFAEFAEPTTHIEKTIESRNFWASDGAQYAVAGAFVGGVMLVYSWVYSLDIGAWIVGGTLLTAVGLHILKIWLHRPPGAQTEPAAAETAHTITIETHQDTGHSRHILIDEIEDKSIKLDELQAVARAYSDGVSFARGPMVKAANISHGKFRKIKAEFERLNLAHTDKGNRNHLSLRGRAFLRQLAE